jgi:hypothetical protein
VHENLHNLSPNIIKVVESSRSRLMGRLERMREMENVVELETVQMI